MNSEDALVVITPTSINQSTRYCASVSTDISLVKDVAIDIVEKSKTHRSNSNTTQSDTNTDSNHTQRRRHCTTGTRSTRQLRRNERERGRKARLNAAFQVLKSVVPDGIATSGSSSSSSDRKMTQVEILRLAKNYISNLTELLRQDSNISFAAFKTD